MMITCPQARGHVLRAGPAKEVECRAAQVARQVLIEALVKFLGGRILISWQEELI
jgi:hypothetical protein